MSNEVGFTESTSMLTAGMPGEKCSHEDAGANSSSIPSRSLQICLSVPLYLE